MNNEDSKSLDMIIQAFLRVKGYENHDYLCIVTAPGDPEAAFITCMDPKRAIGEMITCADILSNNLDRITQ